MAHHFKKTQKTLFFTLVIAAIIFGNAPSVFSMGSGDGNGGSAQQPADQQGPSGNGVSGTQSCGTTADCEQGQACVNNVCVASSQNSNTGDQSLEASGSCKEDTDCADGQTCKNYSCVGPTGSGTSNTSGVGNNNGDGGATSPAGLEKLRGFTKDLNKLKVGSAQELMGVLIRGLMGILGTIALIMMLYGGILWMTARGNSESTSKARDTILWAGLGIVVIFASYALVNFVFEIFR